MVKIESPTCDARLGCRLRCGTWGKLKRGRRTGCGHRTGLGLLLVSFPDSNRACMPSGPPNSIRLQHRVPNLHRNPIRNRQLPTPPNNTQTANLNANLRGQHLNFPEGVSSGPLRGIRKMLIEDLPVRQKNPKLLNRLNDLHKTSKIVDRQTLTRPTLESNQPSPHKKDRATSQKIRSTPLPQPESWCRTNKVPYFTSNNAHTTSKPRPAIATLKPGTRHRPRTRQQGRFRQPRQRGRSRRHASLWSFQRTCSGSR